VVGPAGSGKTHLAEYFKKRGKIAFDCDHVPDLSHWEDLEGNLKELTEKEWRECSGVRWMWNLEKLEELLATNAEIYLFGAAENTFEFSRLFDGLYYLLADRELIVKRLQSGARKNRFGKFPKQRDLVLNTLNGFTADARRHGFKFIDASLPASKIFKIICE
jgi:hypothetical protein